MYITIRMPYSVHTHILTTASHMSNILEMNENLPIENLQHYQIYIRRVSVSYPSVESPIRYRKPEIK